MKTRISFIIIIMGLFIFALTGCEIVFWAPADDTAPVIYSVSHSPRPAYVNTEITFSVSYSEPQTTATVSWDTDMDGNYDDSDSLVYTTAGTKEISVKVVSRGGTSVMDYSFTVSREPAKGEAVLTIKNESGEELTLYINDEEKGGMGDGDVYEYVLSVGWYEIYGENPSYIWGPEDFYLDSDGETFTFLPPAREGKHLSPDKNGVSGTAK